MLRTKNFLFKCLENSLPYCAWLFFTKKFFLVFCLGQLRGLPNNIRHSSRKKNVPVRYDLLVATGEVCWGGRKKESWRPSKNTSSTKRKIHSWMLCGLELFPWPLLKSIFIVKEVPGAVFGIFWASLGFAQSNFLRRPLVPRFYKVSTMALPGDTSSSSVSVLGTTIGNHIQAPRFVGSCRCLWASWTMGIFFGIGKGWVPDMEILDNKMYQSCTGWQTSVVTWIPKGHK